MSGIVVRSGMASLALAAGLAAAMAFRPGASSDAHPAPGPAADTLLLAVVGDLMCHGSQLTAARTADGYDFRPAFAAVRDVLTSADVAIGNLETVTAGAEARFTGYPAFNTPVEYLDALTDAGFDLLTTANNHALDRGFAGVERTIAAIEARGLRHVGTARSESESRQPVILEVNGFRLGVLAYSFSTNGIPLPAGKPFAVRLIDTLAMARDIDATRAAGAEALAVFLHWGMEYERQPNAGQRRLAQFLARHQVDLVLGSHPHVLQPGERLGDPGRRTFTIYSLGNFVSGQRQAHTRSGVILQIPLIREPDSGRLRVGDVRFIPTYVSIENGFRVVPVADALAAQRAGDPSNPSRVSVPSAVLETVWRETTSHLTDSLAGLLPRGR